MKCDVYVPLGYYLSEARPFFSHQIFGDFQNWQKGKLGSHTDLGAQAVYFLAV